MATESPAKEEPVLDHADNQVPAEDSTDAMLQAETEKAKAEGHGAQEAEGEVIPDLENDEDLAVRP